MVEAASNLHPSAKGRHEHAPCVRLHLAPCSTRKLAPSVRASWRLRCRPQPVQVLGRGGEQSASECQEAKTSTHLASASTSHRAAAVASLVAAASTLMPSANDSDELAPCVRLHLAPYSTRKLAPSVRASWQLRCRPQSVQVLDCGSKYSHAECIRQRRASTLRPPPPCTVQHPQACSISESVMAAPLQTTTGAGASSRQQAICTRVPKAATSSHLASASTLHREAPASLLHQ